jgi:hypothetical protein
MQELTGEGRPEVLSTLAAKVTPEHCALLVIDMLNDFLDRGARRRHGRTGRSTTVAP